jgi:flagellar basal-body rod modification protein FlgD
MDVGSVSGLGAPSSADAVGSNVLGKDQFMKLLMAQLANQDPTAPVDSQAFVAQLAQFSSVEQLQTANQSLDQLLMAQAAGNQTSVVALVGKDALFKGNAITLDATHLNGSLVANLAGPADQVTAVITDATGKTVRTMQLGAQPAGQLNCTWDGLDDQKKQAPAGSYTVSITASKAGTSVTVDEEIKAHITGVSFSNGFAELLLGNQRVKLADVIEVAEPVTTQK